MSERYERLCALFETLGLTTERGSYTEAEIRAYAAGLDAVSAETEEIARRIFLDSEAPAPDAYAAMLGIDTAHMESDALLRLLHLRLTHGYGDCAHSEAFQAECGAALGNAVLADGGDTVTVSGITPDSLFRLGSFLAGALPAGREAVLPYGGLTFSEWDALGESFRQYDRLRLPFCCIDTLGTACFKNQG